jgi:hypothetical protein
MKIIKQVKKQNKKSQASIQMTHGWPWQASVGHCAPQVIEN